MVISSQQDGKYKMSKTTPQLLTYEKKTWQRVNRLLDGYNRESETGSFTNLTWWPEEEEEEEEDLLLDRNMLL